MNRSVFVLCSTAALAYACINTESQPVRLLVVDPVLDSVFVGDTLPPRDVYLQDESGNRSSAGPVRWELTDSSVASIDAAGKVAGIKKGAVVVLATASGVTSGALVIVSRALEMTLLLDTLYLMPGDTITVPLAIAQKTPAPTTLKFDSSGTPSVYTMDTTSGLITANATGGPLRYVARLSDGTNSIADTGAVVVMSLLDTTSASNGRFYMTAFGTAIRHQGGSAYAAHYPKLNGKLAFRLVDTLTRNAVQETVLITLRDSVLGPGTFEIDSISPQEAAATISQLNPYCAPKREWAKWTSIPFDPTFPPIVTYSHGTGTDSIAGYLSVTQYVPASGGGAILSGRYLFKAQRTDLYGDPLGAETIRGIFVVPLRVRNVCTA